MDLPAGRRWPT